jgi:hypothetical protein
MLIAAAALGIGLAGGAQAQSPSLSAAAEAAPFAEYMKGKGNKGGHKMKYGKHTPYGWSRGRKVGWSKRGGPRFSIRY